MRIRIVVLMATCLVVGLLPMSQASAASGSPEPFASWTAMVDSQYADLTGVAPTTTQRSAAVSALTAGTLTPGQFSANLRVSDDNVKNVDPVTRLYRAFLLRIPDKGGLDFWIKRRRTGTWTLTKIADSFATSNEFKTRYGALSNLDFVKLIYDNVLERPYDSSGLTYWTRQLDLKRKTRGAVMANFSESNEYKTKQAAEVNVSVLNIFLLGRAPTKTEFDTAVAALEGGQTVTAYATQLFASTAYANRIAAPLVIATPTLPTLYAGVPMQTVLTATGGFGTQTWSATGLPAWATLDPTSGTLSGTPPTAGVTNVTAKVTAGSGMTGTKTVALDVKAGMPAGCVTTECAKLDTTTGTVQVPAATVTSVTRNASGVATAVALSASAPNIANGNILVIANGTNTPSGLIVKVTSFTGTNGAARNVAVTKSTLTDAYANGIVKSSGALEPAPAAAASTRSTRAAGCGVNANINISPEATVGLKPNVTLLWGKNVAGFGDVFVGTGGVKLFQFGLDGDLTFKLKGSITGTVDCSLDVPAARALIPLGPAGFLVFKLTPNIGLKATAGIEIDTTVTVHCSVLYDYRPGSEIRSQWCQPSYTPPKVSTANTGADLTISGGVTASMTFNELIGLDGTITASAHAGYKPLAKPIGVLDGKVTANLSACLACAFGSDAPSLTILDKTIWEKTFARWDSPSPAPTLGITTTSLPGGNVGQPYTATLKAAGGTKPYTWTATGLPSGLTLNSATGAISGTPSSGTTANINATVTDGAATNATKALALTVTSNVSFRVTQASVATDGTQSNNNSDMGGISATGRFVTFSSVASSLVPGDTNDYYDVFLRDQQSGTTTRISTASDGTQGNYNASGGSVSDDGRYVAFESAAGNLVPPFGGGGGNGGVFLKDRQTGLTNRVSTAMDGTPANWSGASAISGDGRYVTYYSYASNIVPGDYNQHSDIFTWDRQTGSTTRVSLASDGTEGDFDATTPDMSSDGRYITYQSDSTTIVAGDTGIDSDVFMWDRQTGITLRVSTDSTGSEGTGNSWNGQISDDGRYITFDSDASNLTPDGSNGYGQVFVWDRQDGTTVRASRAPNGALANSGGGSPSISSDGRYITYMSSSTNLVPGEKYNDNADAFLWDRQTGSTTRISTAPDGSETAEGASQHSKISGDGRHILFLSGATNLVPGGSSGRFNVFVWERLLSQ